MKNFDFYTQPSRTAADFQNTLASALKQGKLGLMVGAGASARLGLPLWHTLAIKCLKSKGFDNEAATIDENTPTQRLLDLMVMVRSSFSDFAPYSQLVHDALYENGLPSPLEATLLLRAIGALCMGSLRGRISEVISYNFDCVLERYLQCHGYVTQVVPNVPALCVTSDLRVWHPHGYLPLDDAKGTLGPRSSELIFDSDSADRMLSRRANAWMDVFRYHFGTKVFIAVGLSGADPITNVVLMGACEALTDDRPLGFWLYKKGQIPAETLTKLKTRKFVPIEFDEYDDIPPFLIGICERAAGNVVV